MRRLSAGVMVFLVIVLALGACDLAMGASLRGANRYDLSTGPTFQVYGDKVHKYVSYTFSLVNGSSRKVLIRKIGQNGPGLQLLVPSGSGKTQKLIPPFGPGKTQTVSPHNSIRLTVWFHVSDCAQVPKGSWPLAIDVAWSSSRWERVNLPITSAGSMQWQNFVADSVCP